MLRHALAGLSAMVLVAGCPKDECPPLVVVSEATCDTSQNCIDQELKELSCIAGICRRPCLRDRDCILPLLEEEDPCLTKTPPQKPAVCEDQLCVDGCTSNTDCSGGTSCEGGRCVYFAEGFEDEDRDGAVSLDQLMWNTVTKELSNARTTVAWKGVSGCLLGDERCAGIASEGDRFVALESVPTPEKGTPEVTLTCRSCACCLDCLVNEPLTDARIPTCPLSDTVPIALTCETMRPEHAAKCADVCSDCNACMGSTAALGDRLLACEQTAAQKTCPSCPSCNAMTCETCRNASCSVQCDNFDSPQCKTCETASCPACGPCRACNVCSRAQDCAISDPNSAECIANNVECDDVQGADGCFPTPINYPRAQLTDLEQALVSPPINLTAASGAISLQFEYVAFNVGEKYYPGIQGTPSTMWIQRDQEVVISICASNCATEAGWSEAKLVNGARASFPPATQRGNGLSLGRQSGVDWGGGRLEIDIPEGMRSTEFRFRLLPRLDNDVVVGIDNIVIRSRR